MPKLKKVDVRTDGGAVILTGAVPSIGASARASELARQVPGVRSVKNELTYDSAMREGSRVSTTGSHAQVMATQQALKDKGFDPGNQMGITEKMAQQRCRAGEARSNALSVLLELQADCFAAVWGHFARQRKLLEPGDVESGLAAAAAIGDDRIQLQSRGHGSPESFTHGSSAQRVRWFRTGLDFGDLRQCPTY